MKRWGVWQLACIEFDDYYELSGVILQKPLQSFKFDYRWYKSAQYIMASYFKKPLAKATLEIRVAEHVYTCFTSAGGGFSIPLAKDENINEIRILHRGQTTEVVQKYPIVFKDIYNKLLVISDIDETILQSFTRNAYKRVSATLFKNVERRKSIEFTFGLYHYLAKRKARFFYVSRSESNLFQLISCFIDYHQIPKGMLYLTGYLNFLKLINNKKEKDFKLNKIINIIENQKEKQVILVGDDSQYDPEIYHQIALRYKTRIVAVYIRETKRRPIQHIAIKNWERKHKSIPLVKFKYNESFSNSSISIIPAELLNA